MSKSEALKILIHHAQQKKNILQKNVKVAIKESTLKTIAQMLKFIFIFLLILYRNSFITKSLWKNSIRKKIIYIKCLLILMEVICNQFFNWRLKQ